MGCLVVAASMVSCGGGTSTKKDENVKLSYSPAPLAAETDSVVCAVDKDGYIVIFDGKTFNGWRGYGKDSIPAKWTIEDGAIKFNG